MQNAKHVQTPLRFMKNNRKHVYSCLGVVLPKVFFGRPFWVFSCWWARKFLLAILVGPTGIYGNSCWANGDLTSNYFLKLDICWPNRNIEEFLLGQRESTEILVGPTEIYRKSCWPNEKRSKDAAGQREFSNERQRPTDKNQR